MSEVFYKKVGKRYKPVSVYESGLLDSLPQGAHLVVVDGGWTSYLRNVDPDYAGLLAAFKLNESALADVLIQAFQLRHQSGGKPWTPKQKKAVDALFEALGKERCLFEYASISEGVRAFGDALMEKCREMQKKMKTP